MCVIQFPAGRAQNKSPRKLETSEGLNIGDCVCDATGRITGLGTVVDTFLSRSTLRVIRYAVRFGDRVIDMPAGRLAKADAANAAPGHIGGAA